jgi:FG-GAP repeat protein
MRKSVTDSCDPKHGIAVGCALSTLLNRFTMFTAFVTAALTPVAWAAPGQQAYLKASNTGAGDAFGVRVAVSGDTVVVGARDEESSATGVNGNQNDNSASNAGAAYVFVRSGTTWTQQAYLKASNPNVSDQFGTSVAISGDTVVVGAWGEDSNATGVNGDQGNNSTVAAGAAYIFVRSGTNWSQQAYLKASDTDVGDDFGVSVGISGDTVVVGSRHEDSSATGVNGDQSDASPNFDSGAAYVFVRSGTNWTQQAYLKASNTGAIDRFGSRVAVSGDTIVVGSPEEDSNATGVNGDQSDNTASLGGAAYVFVRSGTNWSQQAYLKASNTGAGDLFGSSVAVSGDTAAVGARWESSNATGVNGDQSDNSASNAGAAYVFVRSGTNWSQQAYLKASNTRVDRFFGESVAVSGGTVVVGAMWESSSATGVNGDDSDNSVSAAGAAYVFVRNGTNWTQRAYLKASNTGAFDEFGFDVAVSSDTIVVGALGESSNATGVNGDQSDNSVTDSGAAYVFTGFCPSCPHLAIVPDGSGAYFLRYDGIPGLTYRLQRSSDVTGPWDTIDTQTASGSGLIEFHEINPSPVAAFYRTVQP